MRFRYSVNNGSLERQTAKYDFYPYLANRREGGGYPIQPGKEAEGGTRGGSVSSEREQQRKASENPYPSYPRTCTVSIPNPVAGIT